MPVLVVDAGSNDDTSAAARDLGARVLRLPVRAGPAEARNAGAQAVDARVLLFIDADCVPHEDVVRRVREAFEGDPELVALSGSYDDDPPEGGLASQYMNLRHHHTHQGAARDTETFWSGCGAVRRDAFLESGGFDAERYPRPAIEDLELATRLRALGPMRMDPRIQVTHLKHWTLRAVVETDLRCRALPWARLVRDTGEMPDHLNLRTSQRFAVACAPFALAAPLMLVGAVWAGQPVLAIAALAFVAGSLALNADLFRFFARRRGWGFAVGAWALHQLHLSYSGAAFAVVLAFTRPGPGPTR